MNWVVLVLLSAVFFAAANIIRKHVLNKEHTLEFLAARGFFTLILLLFLVPWVNTGVDLRVLSLIYLASLVATVGYYYQTKAQRHTDISYSAPLQSLTPLFLLIIAFLFLHETVSTVQLLGIIAIICGGYIVTLDHAKQLLPSIKQLTSGYGLHILFSVVLLALAAALGKYLLIEVDPVTYLFFGWLFMNLHYIIIDWWQYDWRHLIVDFHKGWHWLLLSGVFSVVSMFLFYESLVLPGVLISLALPLRQISVLIETLFGGTLFHEKNLPRRLFASIIMLVGIVLIAKA